ncbi:MAG: SDR family NAD(P)-dependent oxidoreductase [Bdellovibrionales bacterium]
MSGEVKTVKHFLVTGGAGFIGSHLVDALIAKNHRVTVLDDLSTGKRENVNSEARLVVGDTTDYETVARAFEGIDGCFHLAAVASVEKSVQEWVRTHSVNITSTVNIFQAASKVNKVPVVYTSSAAVYGDATAIPISEDAEKYPLTAYGVDKYACDLHANVAWSVHGIPNIGMRPFNVYGPRQDPGSPYSGVISIFFDRMRQGKPITIFGDGGQMRDFVFVRDAVRAFMAAMVKLMEEPAGHDEINICTGRPTSIQSLADTIAALVNYPDPYNYGPARTGDIRISVGDSVKLSSKLNVTLNTTLTEGLTMMLGRSQVDEEPAAEIRAA